MRVAFILSLPRSGSTLLHHSLCQFEGVSGLSESWILLPFLTDVGKGNGASNISFATLSRATDYVRRSVDPEAWSKSVRSFAAGIYDGLGPGDLYIDKTPRYAPFAKELTGLFPDAHYIVLWRSPVSVIASIERFFGYRKSARHRFIIDLEMAPPALLELRERQDLNVHEVFYEEYVNNRAAETQRIMDFLNVPATPRTTPYVNAGPLGDRTTPLHRSRVGESTYQSNQACSTFTARYIREYICRHESTWDAVGYTSVELARQVDMLHVRRPGLRDVAKEVAGKADMALNSLGRALVTRSSTSNKFYWD